MRTARDRIPEVLRISFYHEALAFFILQYADETIIDDLVRAVKNNTVLEELEELNFLNDVFEIHFHGTDTKWFVYHQVVKSIAAEYGVSVDFVISTTMTIVAAIGGNSTPSISRLWSLFITDKKDLVHLKLINTDLYHWRQSMIDTWRGS